jgi:hypothetical protein
VVRFDPLGLIDEDPDDRSGDEGCTWDNATNTLTCPEPYIPVSPDNGNALIKIMTTFGIIVRRQFSERQTN